MMASQKEPELALPKETWRVILGDGPQTVNRVGHNALLPPVTSVGGAETPTRPVRPLELDWSSKSMGTERLSAAAAAAAAAATVLPHQEYHEPYGIGTPTHKHTHTHTHT